MNRVTQEAFNPLETSIMQVFHPGAYVELKTSRLMTKTKTKIPAYKLLKYWIQSFLVGTPKIIVGFRSDDGVLLKTETLETMRIPRVVRDQPGMFLGETSGI